jgi:tRNA(Ile)-lysidine synthase
VTRPLDAVRSACRRALAPLPPGSLVLVACSGGPDSLALTAGAVQAGRPSGLQVAALVVDHGLQPASADVAAGAAAGAAGLGAAPVLVRRAAVGGGAGPEDAARRARYAVLAEAAAGLDAAAVLLGHTADDQAETVLLGLARGSGARSLAGMAPAGALPGAPRVQLLRPLLGLRRALVHAALAGLEVVPWTDPHNADPAYRRARVRHDLVPVLTDVLGPGAVPALARTADQLRQDDEALTGWAADLAAAHGPEVPSALAAGWPPAVRRRVLRLVLLAAGVPGAGLTAAQLSVLDRLLLAGGTAGPLRLPGGVDAGVRCGRLAVTPRRPAEDRQRLQRNGSDA